MDALTVTAITGAIDFTTILVGIGAIFAALVVLRVAVVGGRKLMKVLGG